MRSGRRGSYLGAILDANTTGYLDALLERLGQELGEGLAGAYLFGSVALEDYRPPRSDLDVAVVSARPLTQAQRERLAARLDHRNLACPARKLELVVYEKGRLAAGEVAFELDLNTGPGLHDWRDDPEASPSHWYVLDVAIGHEHGRTVVGPPVATLFPALEHERILQAIRESLDWHIDSGGTGDAEADPADTVLNACRGWRFLEEGTWSSKSRAGRWALSRTARTDVVGEALARREHGERGPSAAAARRFAAAVRRRAERPPARH